MSEKKSTENLKIVLKNKIKKSISFKTEEQGNTLRNYFLKKNKPENVVFCDFDIAYNDKTGFSNAYLDGINEQLKNANNNNKDIYFRININNKHWIGCKISKKEGEQRKITIFDSSNNKAKDTKIAKKLIEVIDVTNLDISNEIEVTQTVKNHNNNCAFESEVSMLIDAKVIKENEKKEKYIDKKNHLNMDKITNEIDDMETLVKMKYGGNEKQNNKDKNLLLLIMNNKDNIKNFIVKDNNDNDIRVTKIGTEYYMIFENKKACKLRLKDEKYIKEKTFKCNKEVFNYISDNYDIQLNKTISNKIIIDSKEIDKNNFENDLNDNKIEKTRFEGDNFDILRVKGIGNFVICSNNKIYRLKNFDGKYKIDKNTYFDYSENYLLSKVEKVKEEDLDDIEISSIDIEYNLIFHNLNYEFSDKNSGILQYNIEDFNKAYEDFIIELDEKKSEEKNISSNITTERQQIKLNEEKLVDFPKQENKKQESYHHNSNSELSIRNLEILKQHCNKAFNELCNTMSINNSQINQEEDIDNIPVAEEKSNEKELIKIEDQEKQQKQYVIENKAKHIDTIQKTPERKNIKLCENIQKIIINYFNEPSCKDKY